MLDCSSSIKVEIHTTASSPTRVSRAINDVLVDLVIMILRQWYIKYVTFEQKHVLLLMLSSIGTFKGPIRVILRCWCKLLSWMIKKN